MATVIGQPCPTCGYAADPVQDAIDANLDANRRGGASIDLAPRSVKAIRKRYAAGGASIGKLAKDYDVHTSTIHRILRHPL